jgi:pimeloyl-ACP methyl ester carboxylesterase
MRRATIILAIAALAVTLLMCQQEPQTEKTPAPVEVTTGAVLSPDSVIIRYDVRGEGDRALVFIHGWCTERSYWNAQVDEFARDYKVVTLDLAGHGRSGRNRKVWSMQAFGADVAAVVEKLDLPEVILVGHSMGGPVMIEAARLLGPRVTALVCVDVFQNLEYIPTEEERKRYVDFFARDFPDNAYRYVWSLFPPTADSGLVEAIATEMAAAPVEVAIGSYEQLLRYDYAAALKDVRLPIRCINSDEFETKLDINNRVAGSFKVKIMPGHGDFPQIVDPETFNALLDATIEEFWPRPPAPQMSVN